MALGRAPPVRRRRRPDPDRRGAPERRATRSVDFVYRIFNADGGEVEQCGNGARCFVKFVRDQGLTDKRAIRVRTRSGIIEPRLHDDGRIEVDMGPPVFDIARVPFSAGGLAPRRMGEAQLWPLAVDVPGRPEAVRWIEAVSMGNPHAVQVVDSVKAAPVPTEGPCDRAASALSATRQCRLYGDRVAQPRSGCGSTKAAPARRWPAAPGPAPLL